MKKLNVCLCLLLIVLSGASVVLLHQQTAEKNELSQRQYMLSKQERQVKKQALKSYRYQTQQQLAENFFSIYHTYDSQQEYDQRLQKLKRFANSDVLRDKKLFSSDVVAKQSFIETSGLNSKAGDVVYYPTSTTSGVVTVQILGKYSDNDQKSNKKVGSTYAQYRTEIDPDSKKFSSISFLGFENVLSDSDIVEQINNKY